MTEYVRVLDHKTSVKTISIIKEPSATELGLADFKFNPVFSVFDVGTIVPPIPLDNTTIAIMAGYNFELLQKEGVMSIFECGPGKVLTGLNKRITQDINVGTVVL